MRIDRLTSTSLSTSNITRFGGHPSCTNSVPPEICGCIHSCLRTNVHASDGLKVKRQTFNFYLILRQARSLLRLPFDFVGDITSIMYHSGVLVAPILRHRDPQPLLLRFRRRNTTAGERWVKYSELVGETRVSWNWMVFNEFSGKLGDDVFRLLPDISLVPPAQSTLCEEVGFIGAPVRV